MRNMLRGMLDVLMALKDEAKSFNDLRTLRLSPNTILARIREAQEQGLVHQKLHPRTGRKPRIRYELTKQGRDMLKQYSLIIDDYVKLKQEFDELEKRAQEKEKDMRYLLLHGIKESDTKQ